MAHFRQSVGRSHGKSPAVTDELTNDLASLRIDRNRNGAPPPNTTSKALRRGFVFIVITGVVVGGFYAIWPYVEARLYKTEVAVTEILSISPSTSATVLTAQGYVVPQVEARVAPKIIGRIARLHVREGDHVQAGQLIVELDNADQLGAIAAARAKVAAANAKVAAARATEREVQQQISRITPLVERGAAARSTLEDLQVRANSLQATAEAANAEARAAQAEVDAIRVTADETTILAPVTGTIITKPLEVGEMVGPERAILEMADMTTLVVEIDVPEARLSLVRVGSPCEVVLDAFTGRRLRGEVLELGHRIDRAKATVPVKVRFVDPTDGVLPEMSARVGFLTSALSPEQLRAAERIVVPRSAVVQRHGQRVVFVVESGKVHEEEVELGEETRDGVVVVRGPEAGTKVVDHPPATLADGQSVKEKGE